MPTLAQYSGHSLGAVGQIGAVNTIGNVILSLICIKLLAKIGARYIMLISIIACALHFNLYTILSIFIIVIGLFAVIYLIKDPKKLGQKPLGWEKAEDLQKQATEGAASAAGVEYKSALKTPAFWVLVAALLFSVVGSRAFLSKLIWSTSMGT